MKALFASLIFAFSVSAQAAPVVVDVVAGDFDNDGLTDTASLTSPGDHSDYLDLEVQLSTGISVAAPGVTYNNTRGAYGVSTELVLNEAGSLQVYAYNDAIGRNRWHEYTTFAFRDGAMVLAGYTYRYYDTIEPDNFGTCDLNFLTFKGVVQQESIQTPVVLENRRIYMTEVTDDLKTELNARYCGFR